MLKISQDHIDHVYDAVTMMALSTSMLSAGDVDDNTAGELSWMLGSCKKRLGDVLDLMERVYREQELADELSLPEQIAALERRLADRRVEINAGGCK